MRDNMDLETLAELYKALSDKSRLKILALLRQEELCVCELVEVLQMSQPAISQHLRKLKQARLVKERRRGQWVFYMLDGEMYPFLKANLDVLPDCRAELETLKKAGLRITCT